jgi:hypothetical protein
MANLVQNSLELPNRARMSGVFPSNDSYFYPSWTVSFLTYKPLDGAPYRGQDCGRTLSHAVVHKPVNGRRGSHRVLEDNFPFRPVRGLQQNIFCFLFINHFNFTQIQ